MRICLRSSDGICGGSRSLYRTPASASKPRRFNRPVSWSVCDIKASSRRVCASSSINRPARQDIAPLSAIEMKTPAVSPNSCIWPTVIGAARLRPNTSMPIVNDITAVASAAIAITLPVRRRTSARVSILMVISVCARPGDPWNP